MASDRDQYVHRFVCFTDLVDVLHGDVAVAVFKKRDGDFSSIVPETPVGSNSLSRLQTSLDLPVFNLMGRDLRSRS